MLPMINHTSTAMLKTPEYDFHNLLNEFKPEILNALDSWSTIM